MGKRDRGNKEPKKVKKDIKKKTPLTDITSSPTVEVIKKKKNE